MGSTKALLLAGAMALGALGTAHAADLPMPQPQYVPLPEPVQFGGWYLRGDVGVGIASSPEIRSTFFDATGAAITGADLATAVPGFGRNQQSIDDAAFVDVGVGYQFNNWFRLDATGEYRTRQNFHTIEQYDAGVAFGVPGQFYNHDDYNGAVQSSVFLLNAYADLGTWWCLTPFIGGGVGAAYNHVSYVTDRNSGVDITNANGNFFGGVGSGGYGYAGSTGKFNLAYAAMAGVDYAVSPNLKLELSYRYLNMGDVKSAQISCNGSCTHESQKYTLASNDIRIGMRWMFNDIPPAPAPIPYPEAPIVRKY